MDRNRISRRAFGAGIATTATTIAIGANVSAQSTPVTTSTGKLVIYSGRNEELIAPVMEQLKAETGIDLDVRYGSTGELAAQILEEGDNTPAGIFLSQDAGALGALANADRLAPLPQDILEKVPATFSDAQGRWVGVSGRARVVVYQPDMVDEASIPASVLDLPGADLGTIGFAPTNASFQTFITALRLSEGEDNARAWLESLMAADNVIFDGNGPIVDAVGSGEIALGLVNHYYLYEKLAENPDLTAKNHYYLDGDIGGLINVAGVGILAGSGQEETAAVAIRFLLSEGAQQYFADETFEYPLTADVDPSADLPPLSEYIAPDLNLNDLDDLEGTVGLLTELGLI